MIEIESVDDFDAHLRVHRGLANVVLQGLDLTGRTDALLSVSVRSCVFLGCLVGPAALERIQSEKALFFPPFSDLPFQAFRPTLYDADELFDAFSTGDDAVFEDTTDAVVHRWYKESLRSHDVVDLLAQRIHDHTIDDALAQLLDEDRRGENVVAIMGGHGMRRDEDGYREVALLARALTREGFFCASGGGPGAMEATNLGAWMASHSDDSLEGAIELLAEAPTFEPTTEWLASAFEVRDRWPLEDGVVSSLGIPTWHYGHEPPNAFASHIAKYFANSLREDGLLAIAVAGVVFAPGSAGTIQEVFQDAAQNHYKSFGRASPMVFMDTAYWTDHKPVYPLLASLASSHDYADLLGIFDDVDSIVAHLQRHR